MSIPKDKPERIRRILVIEPNPDVGRWLVRLIGRCVWAEPTGMFTDLQDLPSSTALGQTDTLLLDFQALKAFDPGLISNLKSANPGLEVILMDLDKGPALRRMALRLGADCLVAKERVIEELWEHNWAGRNTGAGK